MRFVLMLVSAVAVVAAIFSLVIAVIGFSAAQHACPGNDCFDATSTGWLYGLIATVCSGIAIACINLVWRRGASRAER
jgi:hypothetical protein